MIFIDRVTNRVTSKVRSSPRNSIFVKQRAVEQYRAHKSLILSLIYNLMNNSDVVRKIVVVK